MCINESTPPQMNSLICDICQKPYSTKSNLNVHIKTIHHKILPFQCEFQGCNKSYSTLKRKTIHMRTHLGHRPFECEICKKTFNEKIILKNHMLVHSEEKMHKCEYCSKDYKNKYHLKEHIQIKHLNIKKFECQICNRKFGKKYILDTHMKVHSKEVKPEEIQMIQEIEEKREEGHITEQSSEEEDIFASLINKLEQNNSNFYQHHKFFDNYGEEDHINQFNQLNLNYSYKYHLNYDDFNYQ